jgi:hypothetical protein
MLRPLRAAIAQWAPPSQSPGGDPLAVIAAAWAGVVGPDVAEHARPAQLVRDTLLVVTRSSAWSQQLALLAPQILQGLNSVVGSAAIVRLRFRIGVVRSARRSRSAEPARAHRRRDSPGLPPEATPADALQRLRESLGKRRRVAVHACASCGAPRSGHGMCAPCLGERGSEQMTAAQRLMFEAPWLGYRKTARVLGDLDRDDYERWRRALLNRWWEVLQKARWAKRATAAERLVASSYVLLQSRLDPDRITPAIVRNLLGDELAGLLFERRGQGRGQ